MDAPEGPAPSCGTWVVPQAGHYRQSTQPPALGSQLGSALSAQPPLSRCVVLTIPPDNGSAVQGSILGPPWLVGWTEPCIAFMSFSSGPEGHRGTLAFWPHKIRHLSFMVPSLLTSWHHSPLVGGTGTRNQPESLGPSGTGTRLLPAYVGCHQDWQLLAKKGTQGHPPTATCFSSRLGKRRGPG